MKNLVLVAAILIVSVALPALASEDASALEKRYVALSGYSFKVLTSLEPRVNDLGVELLIAAPIPGSIMSAFGHILLRFVDSKGEPLDDIVVGIEAFTGPQVEYTKGLMGGYRLIPSVYSFNDALLRYQRLDSRAIRRVVIPTTADTRKILIQELKRMAFQPAAFGDYSFIQNNCASALLRIFEKAGLQLWLNSSNLPSIPAQSGDKVRNNGLAPFPELRVDSVSKAIAEWRHVFKQSPGVDRSDEWTITNREQLAAISTKSLYLLYSSVLKLKSEVREEIYGELRRRNLEINLSEIFNLSPLPRWMYQASENDASCDSFELSDLKKRWSERDLAMWSRRVQTQLASLQDDSKRSASNRSNDILASPSMRSSACWTKKILQALDGGK